MTNRIVTTRRALLFAILLVAAALTVPHATLAQQPKVRPAPHMPPPKFVETNGIRMAVYEQAPVEGWTHGFYRYPARFSPEFARAVIRQLSKKGDLVLDPFVGGGNTIPPLEPQVSQG